MIKNPNEFSERDDIGAIASDGGRSAGLWQGVTLAGLSAVVLGLAACQSVQVHESPAYERKRSMSWATDPSCPGIGSDYRSLGSLDGQTRTIPHSGIDIALVEGTPIIAADNGTVVHAGWSYRGGNVVRVNNGVDRDGNTVFSSYVHLARSVVGTGDEVTRGQVVGYSGNTGAWINSIPHLHFQVQASPNEGYSISSSGLLRNVRLMSPHGYWRSSDGRIPVFDPKTGYGDRKGEFNGFTYPIHCKK